MKPNVTSWTEPPYMGYSCMLQHCQDININFISFTFIFHIAYIFYSYKYNLNSFINIKILNIIIILIFSLLNPASGGWEQTFYSWPCHETNILVFLSYTLHVLCILNISYCITLDTLSFLCTFKSLICQFWIVV